MIRPTDSATAFGAWAWRRRRRPGAAAGAGLPRATGGHARNLRRPRASRRNSGRGGFDARFPDLYEDQAFFFKLLLGRGGVCGGPGMGPLSSSSGRNVRGADTRRASMRTTTR